VFGEFVRQRGEQSGHPVIGAIPLWLRPQGEVSGAVAQHQNGAPYTGTTEHAKLLRSTATARASSTQLRAAD
jgi:hypothetical protein